jgi:hypothetical protein
VNETSEKMYGFYGGKRVVVDKGRDPQVNDRQCLMMNRVWKESWLQRLKRKKESWVSMSMR